MQVLIKRTGNSQEQNNIVERCHATTAALGGSPQGC